MPPQLTRAYNEARRRESEIRKPQKAHSRFFLGARCVTGRFERLPMDLPVKFPSDGDVIREEVARFRALSPEERIAYIRDMIAAGAMMIRQSPKADVLRQQALEEKNLARQAV